MSEYKMNQYDLQSYFKSLCNSFYIAYDQVKRLERERESLEDSSTKHKLEEVITYWLNNMETNYEGIKSVLYTIKDNNFSVIVTTKEEIYALIRFYHSHLVKDYPIVNIEEEYREVFPSGEEMYDDFIFAYESDFYINYRPMYMPDLFKKYF